MKVLVILLNLLIAACSGLPRRILVIYNEKSFIDNMVEDAIEYIRSTIAEKGADPYVLEQLNVNVAEIIDFAEGSLASKDVAVLGLSTFQVGSVYYSPLTSRVSFDLTIPNLLVALGNTNFTGTVLGAEAVAECRGRMVMNNARFRGEARVSIGIFSGVTIRNMKVNFDFDGIQSNIDNFLFNGEDYTDTANAVLAHSLPNFIYENRDTVNDWITKNLERLINQLL